MANLKWELSLADVLKHETEMIELTSSKTGNVYTQDVVKSLIVIAIGYEEVTSDLGKFAKVSVADPVNKLEYVIKIPMVKQVVDLSFGVKVRFTNVRGGNMGNNKYWLSADSMDIIHA